MKAFVATSDTISNPNAATFFFLNKNKEEMKNRLRKRIPSKAGTANETYPETE